jgi:tetratricopeptide (TPR) repeat protein
MFVETTQRRTCVACITLMFLISIAAGGAFAQKKELQLSGSKAAVAKFMQARDKGEALEDTGTLFDEVVALDPNFAYAYLFAGQTNPEINANIEKAVTLADKVTPGEREWILATRDANNGDNAGQLSHWQSLVKLYPGDKRVHMQLANYYRNLGDDAKALTHLNDAVRIDPKFAPAYNLIGYSNINLHRNAAAEAAFKTYIKLIPNNANPYDSYAEFLMNTGRFDESIKQYSMALAKDPTFVNSYRGRGNDYAYKGDFEKARENYQWMFDKSTNDFNRTQALSSIENSYVEQGNIAKAMEVNEQRIAMADKVGDTRQVRGLHNLAAFICLETGDISCAEKHYAMAGNVVDSTPVPAAIVANRTFAVSLQRTQILAMKGSLDAARAELAKNWSWVAASDNPNNQKAYYQTAGRIELAAKNYAKANEFLAKANGDDPSVWYYKALAAEGLGGKRTATTLYRKVASWDQLDTTGYAIVRPLAMAKLKN